MKLQRNLFLLFSITVFAVTSTILSVFNYDPFKSGATVFINFYSSLFFSLLGIFSIALYYIKVKLFKTDRIYGVFWPSVRQGSFVAAAISAIMYLQGLRILDWLIGISILIVTILLELFFESKKIIGRKEE